MCGEHTREILQWSYDGASIDEMEIDDLRRR